MLDSERDDENDDDEREDEEDEVQYKVCPPPFLNSHSLARHLPTTVASSGSVARLFKA